MLQVELIVSSGGCFFDALLLRGLALLVFDLLIAHLEVLS